MAPTHDWTVGVDPAHLMAARRVASELPAPHLVLEVLAYVADETDRCVVTYHDDGSVAVSDNGRGTETRLDLDGRPLRKPVMATKDLRFFDHPDAQLLPDGLPRRGISVVAAASAWLVHTNRRDDGAWTQRYEHGVPTGDLRAIPGNGTTGTTVHFLPAERPGPLPIGLTSTAWPHLTIEVVLQDGPAGPPDRRR